KPAHSTASVIFWPRWNSCRGSRRARSPQRCASGRLDSSRACAIMAIMMPSPHSGAYPFMTYSIRLATPGEEMTIALQRRNMFAEMGAVAYLEVEGMDERFADWLRPKLANGEYLGWFAVSEAGEVVGGAGLLIREGAPHHRNF